MKSVEQYELDVKHIHNKLLENPQSAKLKGQLAYKLRMWVQLLPVIVRVAKNEQKPWSEEEIGIPTFPMRPKVDSKYNQVGDYHFEIQNSGGHEFTGGLVVERKELSDLYGTLLNQKQRHRFNREIDKFRDDPRFDQMMVLVEGTVEEYLSYIPKVYVFRWDTIPGVGSTRLAEYLNRYYQLHEVKAEHVKKHDATTIIVKTEAHNVFLGFTSDESVDFYIDGELRDTLTVESKYGHKDLYQLKGASRNSKLATIAKLEISGIHVEWCGSRKIATEIYPYLIQQWLKLHYAKVIGISE